MNKPSPTVMKHPGYSPGHPGINRMVETVLLPTKKDYPSSCCPEPHHASMTDAAAHKLHHWKERLTCLGLCVALHVALEIITHVWLH